MTYQIVSERKLKRKVKIIHPGEVYKLVKRYADAKQGGVMKRKPPTSLISKWKKAFSKTDKPEADVPSLALIKKVPITFQLSRLENPLDFERMSFVIKACAKKAETDKPFKSVLRVEQTKTGSRLIACDGQRLHVAEISKRIKSGHYKPYVTKDAVTLGEPVEGVKFPSWSKAIPENTEKRGEINLEKSGLGRDRKETEKLSIAFNTVAKQTGETVNLGFIEDLPKREWTVYSLNEKGKVIVLRQKTTKAGEPDGKSPVAVIMPIDQAA
jgi:hypothetical protein